MIHPSSERRRFARDLARAGVLISAVMLVSGLGAAGGRHATAAAVDGGALSVNQGGSNPLVPIATGGSATAFFLNPPTGAACPGDSVTGGYRVQSYMVPSTVDPTTLTFGLTGPTPTAEGAAFRQPLYSSVGSAWVNKTTAVTTGLLITLPTISFAWATGGLATLPAGTYNLGFACTKNSGAQLDKYWNVQLTFEANQADPLGFSWTVPAATTTTTTTSTTTSTTTTIAATTTSVGATTTIRPTTTVAGGSTTSSTVASSSTTTTTFFISGAGGSGSGAGSGSGSGGGTIVATGSSPIPILLWGVLLLVFGRMALLLGRQVRVLPPKSR